MSQAMQFLERAFQLARLEQAALRTKNYDRAVELSAQRQTLLEQAWDTLEESEHPAYRERLLQLVDLQKELSSLAAEARKGVLVNLQGSRLQKKRLSGYRRTVALSLQ